MKAIVLVDNIGNDVTKGEWGLSIYIEYNDKKVLLDVGGSNLFLKNAKRMGIAIEQVDFAVLSHAHYDHAGGMKDYFENTIDTKFYVQQTCKENCYFKKWIFHKYIGIPKGVLEKYSNRIVFAKGDYNISKGVSLIPHKTEGLSAIGKREMMYQREVSGWVQDDFSHEQSLVFKTENGLVIFNSCSHGGADTIINEVQATYPEENILALIGGFHLVKTPEKMVRDLAKGIKKTGVKHVYTGHCTGKRAYNILKEELGDIVEQLHVGLVMEF